MPVITETSEKKWNKVDKLEISKMLPACHLRILIKLWLKILRKDSCDKHRNDLLKRTKGSWYHLTSLPFLCMCSQGGFLTLRMRNMYFLIFYLSFLHGSVVKNPRANAGDADWIPGWGRVPGEGNGNPPQYSCLGNSTDREASWATVYGVAKKVEHDLATKQQ